MKITEYILTLSSVLPCSQARVFPPISCRSVEAGLSDILEGTPGAGLHLQDAGNPTDEVWMPNPTGEDKQKRNNLRTILTGMKKV